MRPDVWAMDDASDSAHKQAYAASHGVDACVLWDDDLRGFPEVSLDLGRDRASRKRVIVTGCFDWLHSGPGIHRSWVDGCRTRDRLTEAGHLWGEPGRRQA